MKRQLLAMIVVLVAVGFAHADLRIPGSVFKMEELEEAKEKAKKDEEPLIFVYTDPTTS